MPIKFDPSPYLNVFRYKQEQDNANRQKEMDSMVNATKGVNQFAQDKMSYDNQQKQDQMQQLMLAMKAKESGFDFTPNGQTPPSTDEGSIMPSPAPQMPQVGPYSNPQPEGAMPTTTGGSYASPPSPMLRPQESPLVTAHKTHLAQFRTRGGTFTESAPPDYAGVINQVKSGDYSGFSKLGEKQKADLKELPAFKALSKENSSQSYSADDISDAEKGNWAGIAARNGGKIPSSLATLGESASSKSDAAYEKKRNDAQTALTNVRGDQSVARTELQRDSAAMAYNTLQRIKSDNRLPTQLEWHDIINQMLRARTGSFNEQAANALVQKTAQGKLGDVYTYFTGNIAPATSSELVQNLQDFVTESGLDAEKQHEGYMAPRRTKLLNGLKPEDQERLSTMTRGLSFQDQTGYSPAPKINSQQEYDALPSGSEYIDSTGRRARKK